MTKAKLTKFRFKVDSKQIDADHKIARQSLEFVERMDCLFHFDNRD